MGSEANTLLGELTHSPVLRLERLTKKYSDNILFRDLNLTIPAGHAIHLRGANGSGKTQLMLVIAGLVEPDAGRIVFRDERDSLLNRLEPDKRAEVTRFVPYLPGGLAEMPIDRALLVLTRRLQPFSLRSQKLAAARAMNEISNDLSSISNDQLDVNRALANYSIGQQKRFMASASIGVKPYPFLAMLDEPLAALDAEGITRVLELMREAKSKGIALLISEHRPEIFNFDFDDELKLPYDPNAREVTSQLSSELDRDLSPGPNGETVLLARDLVGGYVNSAVSCSTFTAAKGELVVIQGPNGSGKTGFIRGLLGYPNTTLSGHLEFANQPVTDLKSAQRQSSLRYLSQTRDLFPDLTVQESIAVANRGHDTDLSQEIAEIAGLLGRNKLARHLSSGGRSLLGLAQALAADPQLLILDEPLANTDVNIKARIWELLNHVRCQGRTAIIVIEHDATLAPGSSLYQIELQGKSRTLTKV